MSRMVLEFHGYRENKPSDEHEIIALFLFTLRSAADCRSGLKADHTKTFWTEVGLSRDLASRGKWAQLSREDKLKAMFRYAQEKIVESGRKLRQVPMFWTTSSPLRDGPPWDLAGIQFPKAPPVELERPTPAENPYLEDRRAAGLLK
ncbi:MAG TPA: hypothetical protein VMT52_14545 [Planctomycetota bacterium]|nr:hypothetical protein [Planctomycetota bacterium]